MKTACELFDFALKPKENWALKLATTAVLGNARGQALPATRADVGLERRSSCFWVGVLKAGVGVLDWAVGQVPNLTCYLLLSLAQHLCHL